MEVKIIVESNLYAYSLKLIEAVKDGWEIREEDAPFAYQSTFTATLQKLPKQEVVQQVTEQVSQQQVSQPVKQTQRKGAK